MTDLATILLSTLLILTNWSKLQNAVIWVWNCSVWLYHFISRSLAQPTPTGVVPLWDANTGNFSGFVILDDAPPTLALGIRSSGQPAIPTTIAPPPQVPAIHDPPPAAESSLIVLSVWDGWPNGSFACNFTAQDVRNTGDVFMNWIYSSGRGRQGRAAALTWEKGKETRRKCLGAIVCKSQHCSAVIAPHKKSPVLATQLRHHCVLCHAALVHQTCEVTTVIWFYNDGAHLINSGGHTHGAFTHTLRRPEPRLPFGMEPYVSRNPVRLRSLDDTLPPTQNLSIHVPKPLEVPSQIAQLFLSAIPVIVGLLSPADPKELNLRHPVLRSYFKYQMELEEMSHSARKASPPWLVTTGLALPQFLEDHYDEVLRELIFHPDMAELPVSERNARISSMGRAFLEFLWIQYELGESYNLGVDLLRGIQNRSVVSHGRNSDEVAEEMFSASSSTHVKAFKSSHILRDRPTIYRRRTGSQVVKHAASIPVTIDPEARSNIFRYTRANGRRAAAEALGDANGDGSVKKRRKK